MEPIDGVVLRLFEGVVAPAPCRTCAKTRPLINSTTPATSHPNPLVANLPTMLLFLRSFQHTHTRTLSCLQTSALSILKAPSLRMWKTKCYGICNTNHRVIRVFIVAFKLQVNIFNNDVVYIINQ